MTKADEIRGKTDAELAEFIRGVYLAGKNGEGFGEFGYNLEAWLSEEVPRAIAPETVLKGLMAHNSHNDCASCPYEVYERRCAYTLLSDAEKLIKCQEEPATVYAGKINYCPTCLHELRRASDAFCCGHCGQRLKWV